MKKIYFISVLTVMVIGLMGGAALAKVAIVKADNIDLCLNTYKMNTDRTFMQGRVVGRKMDVICAEWTKESEAYIGKLTREAIELAGDWPVKRGDVVLIKPNTVISFIDFWKMWTYAPALSKDPVKMQCQTTDPRVVREVCIMAHESGARRIIIGEASNAGHALAGLQGYGYNHMVEDLGAQGINVEIIDFDDPQGSCGRGGCPDQCASAQVPHSGRYYLQPEALRRWADARPGLWYLQAGRASPEISGMVHGYQHHP
jgi:hypothetical protein